MRTVFLDTVGLLALWDRVDQWHAAASAAFTELNLAECRLVTSTYVLLECANAAARKPYRSEVPRLRDQLGMAGDLFEPTVDEVQAAWAEYANAAHARAGMIDLVSFTLMRRLEIQEAFTNDKHFSIAGFKVLF